MTDFLFENALHDTTCGPKNGSDWMRQKDCFRDCFFLYCARRPDVQKCQLKLALPVRWTQSRLLFSKARYPTGCLTWKYVRSSTTACVTGCRATTARRLSSDAYMSHEIAVTQSCQSRGQSLQIPINQSINQSITFIALKRQRKLNPMRGESHSSDKQLTNKESLDVNKKRWK